MSIKVDLPDPDGPTNPTMLFTGIDIFTLLITRSFLFGYLKLIFSSDICFLELKKYCFLLHSLTLFS